MLTVYKTTKSKNQDFANRVFSCFLALTFLILPSVSIKIFSTFACRDFDESYGHFLKVDYNIDCHSSAHEGFKAYVRERHARAYIYASY